MGATKRPPTREEVEAWFAGLIEGTRTRDQADRWAARWFCDPQADPVEDGVVGWALDVLYGIDLPAGPDGRFLHDDAQLRTWLMEFQRRSSLE